MPIKLSKPDHAPFDGLIVDTQTIVDMVKEYRKNHSIDPNCLKFIHFNLQEVIQLFIDNGVLDPDEALSDQMDEGGLGGYGLKIYLGNHVNNSTVPPSIPGST